MPYVLGVIAIAFLAFLVIGALTGRVKVQSCCTIADAEHDLRVTPASTTAGQATDA